MADISKIKLPDNTVLNIKDSNAYIKPSGGIPETDLASAVTSKLNATEIFWATYGTTTQTEIQSAVTAGKMVACAYGDNIYRYEGKSSAGYAQFTAVVYNTACRLCCKNSSWGTASFTIAQSSDIHNIPSGGTTGQVLKKVSGTNYDVEWANESGGSSDEALTTSEIQDIWDDVMN